MRGKYQPRLVAQVRRQCRGSLGDPVTKHLHQKGVIEVLPQLHQFRCAGAGGLPGTSDVLLVLGASRIATPSRGAENRDARNAIGCHRCDGVLDERIGVAVAEVHRQILATVGELSANFFDQRAVDPVDRRHTAEVQVVLRDAGQALRWNPPAPGHLLQERHDLLGALGSTEGQQQQCVEVLRHRRNWGHHSNWVLAPPSA